jgi:hypothetical protein
MGKVTGSRDGYFFGGLNFMICTFCLCADGFQALSKAFHYPIQLFNFLFGLFESANTFYK